MEINHIAKFHDCAALINTNYQKNQYIDADDLSKLDNNICQYISKYDVMPGDILFVGSKNPGYPEYGFVIIDENKKPIFDEFAYNLLYKIEKLIKKYQINYTKAFDEIAMSNHADIFFIEGVSERDSVTQEYQNAGLWFIQQNNNQIPSQTNIVVPNTQTYYSLITKCQTGAGREQYIKITNSVIGVRFRIWMNKNNNSSWNETWVNGKIIDFDQTYYEHVAELEDGRKININIERKIKDEYDTGIKWFEFIKID